MDDIAIRVENLGKLYHIGVGQRHDTLRDALADFRLRVADFGRKNPKSQIKNPKSEEFWALKDVSFEVHRGEVVGVIGRNGAGKSTLLKILSRITEPTTGYAEIHGRVGSLLEVGTGFHPELTGRENIYLNGAILGMKRTEIDRKFDEIVAFAEIEKFLDTPVKRYSSGMYVRLAFAVAAHLEPEILLVDEVLSVGDAAFQKKCLGKMGDIAGEGRTVLFVSHNLTALANLCSRSIYLMKGIIHCTDDSLICIQRYMKDSQPYSETQSLKQQIDELPPDPVCEITGLDFIQRDQPTRNVASNVSICVTISYRIKQSVYGLRVGFDIIHDDGTVVFRTFHDDLMRTTTETLPGLYKSTAVIPSNLLAPGFYTLSLAVGIHNIRWIISDKVIYKFEVSNIEGINVHYADKRPGVVMPYIQWETTKEKSVEEDMRS